MTVTLHRDSIALVVPHGLRGELKALYDKADQKHNGYLTLTLDVPKRPRTVGEKSQNRAINGYIQQICKETGNDFDDVKLYCKTEALSRGYPFKVNDKGEIITSLTTGEPVPESESKISVEEASVLIETIVQLASELGIVLKNID